MHSFIFHCSEAIVDGNMFTQCVEVNGSAVSCVLYDNYFCESHHNFLSCKALSEVKLAKHESIQKQVSSSLGKKILVGFIMRLGFFSKKI